MTQPTGDRSDIESVNSSREELERNAAEEHEADVLLADIDSYVATTAPEDLQRAEVELNNWQIPTDPSDRDPNAELHPDEALVSVFAAGSESEALIVKGILDAEGIMATFDGLQTKAWGNVFSAGESHWAHVMVPESLAVRAVEAIKEAQLP